MKKLFIIPCLLLGINAGYSQSEMKTVWSTKLEHKAEMIELDENSDRVISSSEKIISMLDAKTGAVKWSKDFKTMSGGLLKKVDERIPLWEANAIFLFDRKGGKDQMAVVDLESGNMLWSSDKYEDVTANSIVYLSEIGMFAIAAKKSFHMIKAKTGEEVWETQGFKGKLARYIYNGNDNTMTALNYNPAAAGESLLGGFGKIAASFGGFKSQISKINVKTGEIIWQTEIKGVVEKEIVSGKILAKLSQKGDIILLTMQGLQAYNYNNGSLIWGVTHSDEVLKSINNGIGSGYSQKAVYGAVAQPLIDGNDVYVFDMQSKSKQYVSKYDINTGKLIWKSKELKKLTIAPNMYKVGNRIIIQIGGWAQVQAIREARSGGLVSSFSAGSGSSIFYKEFGPFGVEALDAANGEIVWRSERFAKGVTNAFVHNNELIVASGKELYDLNPENGTEKYSISVKDDDIKETEQIFKLGENAIIVCTKGVSSHAIGNGSKNWSTRTKKGDLSEVRNGMALYQNDNSDKVIIDLSNGKYTTYDAKKGSDAVLYSDGQFMIITEKSTVSKLQTKE